MSATTKAEPELAPEVGEVVREARAAFARAEQKAELGNDPLRYVLQALSLHLDAQHKLYVDGNLTLTEQIKRGQKPDVKEIAEALAAEAKGRIAAGCIGEFNQNLAALMRRHTWRNTLIGAGLLAAALAIGWVGGAWFGYANADAARAGLSRELTGAQAAEWRDLIQMNDIASAPRTCGAQHGGEACTFTLWTKLPSAGGQ